MLIDYLVEKENLSLKKAKLYLTNRCILVNGKIITKYNYLLKENDNVKIIKHDKNNNFDILYEDKYIIAVYKKEGLLTVASLKEKEKTLYHMVGEYLREKNKHSKVFIIHRLDRDTSGIVIFAKDERTKKIVQNNWDDLVKRRGYIALVSGVLKNSNSLVDYLKENNNYRVYITNSKNGKKAITNYKVINSNNRYSLLDIDIETGRKNQIRVQLSNINHPILGDKKYGGEKGKRLYLEANHLELTHPITKKLLSLKLDINKEFLKIIK